MAEREGVLRFFSDQNVPDSICRYLRQRGHVVLKLRDYIPDDSPDPIVGMTALTANCILISWDKDFNSQRFRQPRFATLSRLALSGDGPSLSVAVKEHVEVLEFQFRRIPKDGRTVAHVKVGDVRFRHN